MFKNLKKFLVLIPCMVVGFFLFSGIKTLAADAVLSNATNKVVIGSDSKENTYYFSNGSTWEFKAEFSAIKEWDTFLRWRVVRPDGKATDWSTKDYYVDNQGKFTIKDYKKLSYNKTDDVKGKRNSVAPAMTYYVDIQYYGQLVFEWHQDKDETIKIVVSEDADLGTPTLDIAYDESAQKFTISSAFQQDGYGIITSMEYFFSANDEVINSYVDFTDAMKNSTEKGKLAITPSSSVTVSLDSPSTTYSNLYVAAKSGNGYVKIASYDLDDPDNNSTNDKDDTNSQQNQNSEGSGLFDYDFGQLILIILVIVLIVSCALIITQKIVDYKKRLY